MKPRYLMMKPCDACGARAVVGVLDYSEKINSSGIIEKFPSGDVHYFCQVHKRDSQLMFINNELLYPVGMEDSFSIY